MEIYSSYEDEVIIQEDVVIFSCQERTVLTEQLVDHDQFDHSLLISRQN